eukprot:1157850-Pelagomonas_calceolata.AAC.19
MLALPWHMQKIATREEVENYATEAMVKEYIDKRRVELEDLIKFNMAVDEIFEKEQIPLEDEEVQAEVDLRKKSYQAPSSASAHFYVRQACMCIRGAWAYTRSLSFAYVLMFTYFSGYQGWRVRTAG